eukprot:jgi/Ulvmu1/12810/UM097_0039.1
MLSPLAWLYIIFNFASALGIVFANKAVFAIFKFPYPIGLTWIHSLFTMAGMQLMCMAGFFTPAEGVGPRQVVDLGAAYIGYIVLGNLSIKLNTVGFYQVSKAMIAPTILVINSFSAGQMPRGEVLASVTTLTVGILVATVSDAQVMSNGPGMLVGVASVISTALYNILAGQKQKALGASSNQLLHRFSPVAAAMLTVAAPLTEIATARLTPAASAAAIPLFQPSAPALAIILASAMLGLLVTLSTFLVIGHTSALTYNVVGHLKTVGIISGGILFYGETMPAKKLVGLLVAAAGIAWYTMLNMQPPQKRANGGNTPLRFLSPTAKVAPSSPPPARGP